jgi:hypothetical protein
MMISDCGACRQGTWWAFGAQFMNKGEHVIICPECWDAGQRCWVKDDGRLIVSEKQPQHSRQAVLYWDEGLMTTKGEGLATTPDGDIITYPSQDQPVAT